MPRGINKTQHKETGSRYSECNSYNLVMENKKWHHDSYTECRYPECHYAECRGSQEIT